MRKLVAIFLVTIITVLGLYLLQTRPKPSLTKEQAILQAQEYQSYENCTYALVDAVHTETGARYTFPNGCLAPGWEPDR